MYQKRANLIFSEKKKKNHKIARLLSPGIPIFLCPVSKRGHILNNITAELLSRMQQIIAYIISSYFKINILE